MRNKGFSGVLTTLLVLAASSAFAAEMPLKAPPPPPPPVPIWAGFYIGGNVGGGWSRQQFIDNFDAPFGAVDATPNSSGVVGGGQAGYNWQINNWGLIGVEGGFTGTNAKSTFSCFPLLAPQTCTADTKWVADIALRAGLIWGPALFYVKGGAAWEKSTWTDIALAGAPAMALPGVLFTANDTRDGWVVGAGFEYLFLPNWSARIEYDYYGFPNESIGFYGPPGDFFTEVIKENFQTVTVGINYHFNWLAAPPVQTRY